MSTLSDFADVQYIPMSFEDYLALPEEWPKTEYVDGVAIVSPFARRAHNRAALELALCLRKALPGADVVLNAGVHLPQRQRYRVPDLAAFPTVEDVLFSEVMPLLVVEVLSPSTRAEDTLRKRVEYAEAGIAQYWLLDHQERILTVLSNRAGTWEVLLELADDAPEGVVEVEGHGEIELDLRVLLGPPSRAEQA